MMRAMTIALETDPSRYARRGTKNGRRSVMARYWNVARLLRQGWAFRYSHAMDIVYLRDLEIECIIGIFDWERRIKQTIVLDLDMAADICRAAANDRIEDTLDYKAVSKRVIEFVAASQFQLVETL